MAHQLVDAHYHLARTNELTRYENVEELLDYKKRAGLKAICIHNIIFSYTRMYLRNPLSLLAKLQDPKEIYAFGGICMPEPEDQWKPYSYKEQAEQLLEMGFDGIKVLNKPKYKRYWQIPYYHENFDEMWQFLQEKQTPIMFHIGDPKEFWILGKVPKPVYDYGWFYDKEIPSYASFYQETEELLKKFPNLNLTIPHFYFLSDNIKRLDRFMQTYPQIRIDITPGGEMFYNFSVCQDTAREFFLSYHDRILFGTDNHGSERTGAGEWEREMQANQKKIEEMQGFLRKEESYFEEADLNGLSLPEEVLADIEENNFFRWVGTTPKKVNVKATLKMAEELRKLAEQKNDSPESLPEFDKTIEALKKWQ